jgi:hypothetical protein
MEAATFAALTATVAGAEYIILCAAAFLSGRSLTVGATMLFFMLTSATGAAWLLMTKGPF